MNEPDWNLAILTVLVAMFAVHQALVSRIQFGKLDEIIEELRKRGDK